MSKAFVVPYLGAVEIEDQLVHYDGPQLFTIRSENGGRYLGFWASETDAGSVFWYSAIADHCYRKLLRGEIEVRSVFTEANVVLEAHCSAVGSCYTSADWKQASDLDPEALPELGYCLEASPQDTTLSVGFVETAHILAARVGRVVARLIFDFGEGIHEGPARAIASAILNIQRAIDAIAHSKVGDPKERGAIPAAITENTRLLLHPIRAGSLGIELIAAHGGNILNESEVGQSVDILLDLFQAGYEQEKLKERFSPLTARAAKAYRYLFQSFADSGANLSVEIGLPHAAAERWAFLNKNDILEVVKAMQVIEKSKRTELKFNARLVGYNCDTRSFQLDRLEDDETFKGKASGQAVDSARCATLSKDYMVRILENVDYDSVTGEPTSRYELIELTDLQS
jgi:hypothetical protein